MQKVRNISSTLTPRIIAASLLVAALAHVTIWATHGRSTPLYLYIEGLPFATLLPHMACLVGIAAIVYILVRRKIAAVAAVASTLLISSLVNVAGLVHEEAAALSSSLLAIASTMVFYGFYRFLMVARNPRVVGAVLLVVMVIVSLVISNLLLYQLRLNHPL